MIILLALSSLPVLAIVFTIGGVTLRDFMFFMLLIVVTAVFAGSIGMFFSTLFKKTTSATVSTYGVLLILGIGTLAILWGIRLLMEIKMNQFSTGAFMYQTPDVGNWMLILLINPGVTFFAMIEDQIGTGSELISFFGNFGTVARSTQEHWFIISILLQLGVSVILLIGSSALLDPLRDRHCKKRKH